jgi:hypothetical protein
MADLGKLLDLFPEDVLEDKQGMTYIGHELIRERVIQCTDNQFDWEVTSVDYRADGVVRDRTNRNTGETFTPQVMVVIGKLTIPGLGMRTGMGVNVLEGGGGEDSYKAAESDAFKRAAMAFGVGLKQLYIDTSAAKREQKRGGRTPTPIRSAPVRSPEPRSEAKTPEGELTPPQYAAAVKAALDGRRGDEYLKLVEQAGENIGRWIALVKAASTETALVWIEKQIEDREIANTNLNAEIGKQRARLREEG